MAMTVLLYLTVLAGFIPAGYIAWSLKWAAEALEAHNRAREPDCPTHQLGRVSGHRGLQAP
jgi:hypothetical protein